MFVELPKHQIQSLPPILLYLTIGLVDTSVISKTQLLTKYQFNMSTTLLRSSTVFRSALRNSITLSKIVRPATIPSFARSKATLPDLPCI